MFHKKQAVLAQHFRQFNWEHYINNGYIHHSRKSTLKLYNFATYMSQTVSYYEYRNQFLLQTI